MKALDCSASDPGRKDSPLPAWLLRYAAQTAPVPSTKAPKPEDPEEKDFTELDHFQEIPTSEPGHPQTPPDETINE